MIIKKGEREYSVTELSHEWKAERLSAALRSSTKYRKRPRRTRRRSKGISLKTKSFEE